MATQPNFNKTATTKSKADEEKRTDRRVLRTKKAIRTAFTALLAQKEINEITVKDIADKADINRKTFYYYYEGVYEVVDEIENELVEALDQMFSEIDFKDPTQTPHIIFEKITEVLNGDITFFTQLLKLNGSADLINKILKVLKRKVEETYLNQLKLDKQSTDFISSYCLSGVLNAYTQQYFTNAFNAPEELTKDLSIIMFEGINGYVREKTQNKLIN